MEHYALRKYRGPEVWARVRQAYLAGESAPSVARRFDVGLGNLRKRASAEGWTRSRVALRTDPKPDRSAAPVGQAADLVGEAPDETPEYPVGTREALKRAAERAAWLIAEGRGAEAMVLVRAAEALSNLVDARDLDRESVIRPFLEQRASTVACAKARRL